MVATLVAASCGDDGGGQDNGDGAIDLCDVPDVVVLAGGWGQELPGYIHVFDGATGVEHFMIPDVLSNTVGLALGDIDNDGLPEILAAKIGGIRSAMRRTSSPMVDASFC